MIRLENLAKSFPDGDLFNNVNVTIKRGMRIGLVGPNGSGKTTLLRIMLGKDSPDLGNVQVDKSTTIGYLAQDIIAGTGRSILEEVLIAYPEVRELEGTILALTEAISKDHDNIGLVNKLGDAQYRFEALGGWNLEDKAKKILSGLGFSDEKFTEPMDVFSGGWRMRVALASILLQEPDILFLDEPTNHLDLEATIWLENFLADWKGGMVMISHDRSFLDRSINNILEIDLKKITMFHGNYTKYTEEKALRIEQHRNAFQNQQKQIKDTERFIERFRSKNTKATQVQSRVKMLDKLEKIEAPTEHNYAMNLRLPQPSRSPLNVASCRSVTKHYGDIEVFNNLDMEVERGQKIGLVGHNGAGKSTLLKMFAGVESVTSGAVRIGPSVESAYYAQHQLETLDLNETVFESIQKVSTGWSENEMRTYLGSFMFSGDEINKYIKVLSGGEKARVALARMLVKPSHLLLLDEPTNHLDMITRNVVERALIQFSGSIVCISHDRHFLNNVTNLTCEVGNGGIRLFKGNYDYYDWKKQEIKETKSDIPKVKTQSKGKPNYKKRKKVRNRLSWIDKRFYTIENELEIQRSIIQDPENGRDFELLQKTLEKMTDLESEYLGLMSEKEILMNKS
ncbi:MAG: ABC-F family ATP-binding cassette domain-containing protein [Candidatus Marinimicrobia bacterium]|jgi:ATP-binding cassette subfamily F protein 3|nr:ABC-F family ATP-binding cassette domain-containing protein [Candidatus Neomarinimicrobiota bacterium]MBT3617675.1 ABC-F family ATP-binding cassette domain-containing protein [Candidatus Neomarinimicrobiota bacterium]MBT3829051.1 ABC-F family ATP-binding cassette domain-containing protein [Candidatus Neomarinimicrobiota bacterium]MBT3997767.1 ABC-F family ATP-binding cassette domain-containing protein [Candidatus Neomarinimicrobiota bacterium]MBT4281346.1 ABC-F family ATP-binding cassette do